MLSLPLTLLVLAADGGSMPTPTPTTPVRPTGYPLARLNVKNNPLVPLELKLDDAALKKRHVKQVHRFSATTPRVWLIALELPSWKEAGELEAHLDELFPANGAPYYRKTSTTGGWLLVTGFPSEKPVSPQMESARIDFLSSWAGEE